VDLSVLHTVAKNAIFMIEGLNAVLRTLDSATASHADATHNTSRHWKNIHRSLRYRAELFQSTMLRTVSSQERIKNVIDLVGAELGLPQSVFAAADV